MTEPKERWVGEFHDGAVAGRLDRVLNTRSESSYCSEFQYGRGYRQGWHEKDREIRERKSCA